MKNRNNSTPPPSGFPPQDPYNNTYNTQKQDQQNTSGSAAFQSDQTRRHTQASYSQGAGYDPLGQQTQRQQSVYDSAPGFDPRQQKARTIDQENAEELAIISEDFHKRLRGKPTHAARSHSWYSGLGRSVWSAIKLIVVLLLVVSFVIGGFGGGMLAAYISTAEPLTSSDLKTSVKVETSFIYDINGNQIAKLKGSENIDSIYISYGAVKDTYLAAAITSIEDERFYTHNGIDIQRIGSAILSAFTNGGTATHGGSTITQQTVKMISGKDQRSTQRKVQEWFSAMNLEQELSKDEIMELYINYAPMGNNYTGVQAAAKNYFGKDAKDLSLVECAFLAGIPKSPSYYNPLLESGKRNAMRRMRVVLAKMHELGKITDQQYEEALNTELVFKAREEAATNTVNSYFVDYAIQQVIKDLQVKRNMTEKLAIKTVYNGGYKIYTTMEPETQTALDQTYQKQELFQKDPTLLVNLPEKPQSGMAVINVQTGAIAGLAGGYGEKTINMGWNRATNTYRQPGSSIKPLIDYAPALEIGKITAATYFDDKVLHLDPNDPGRDWPTNSSHSYAGPMTIRNAIVKSVNTIAVQVWVDVLGADNALLFLKQVGIDRTKETYPSTAVGGFNVGMSPLQMAAAYATFANGGNYREPYAYTKVVDSEGNVILEHKVEPKQVYSDSTAFIISDILKEVIVRGTAANRVQQLVTDSGEHIDVAGKTGTTDDDVDKWFCGYTPYYAAATWYGFDNNLRTKPVYTIDQQNAMLIWNDAMQSIHKSLTGADFAQPESVVKLEVCNETRLLATNSCTSVTTEYFTVGGSLTPTTYCPGHAPPPPVETAPPETAPVDPGADPGADPAPAA